MRNLHTDAVVDLGYDCNKGNRSFKTKTNLKMAANSLSKLYVIGSGEE